LPVQASDIGGILALARNEEVDLAVIGPEDPLIVGLADELRAGGIAVFGPGRDGAALEGSKAFSKQLMREAAVPTAGFEVFTDADLAHAYVSSSSRKLVIKASGAALGKGVIVTDTAEEAHEAVDDILVDGAFGESGRTIVIEERLAGREFSLLTLCSEAGIYSLPVAQDYKRALDGDRGPNTGGMGSISPVDWVTPDLVLRTEDLVAKPILAALARRGISYRGVLFSGLMLSEDDLSCLEYNVRFGDPETESVMLRIGFGLGEALMACALGRPIPPIEVLDNAAVTVVVASGGYPNAYEKGKPIEIGELPLDARAFHAGTVEREGRLVTNGGRVLAVSASAADVAGARALAYEAVKAVKFDGAYCRRDI
jgi:phosphoribosylamine--glycine ligase